MRNATLKLIAVSIGVLFLFVFCLFFIRTVGLKQSFKAPPHAWFKLREWNFWNTPLQDLCRGENVDNLVPNPDWIVSISLNKSQDGWVIPCENPIKIDDYLQGQSHRNWLLRPGANDSEGLDLLIKQVSPFNKKHKFAVIIRSQIASRHLRKKAPEWLYAADSGSLLRFRIFESLWIESAMDFWPDFVIVGENDPVKIGERGVKELLRREKRVVWNSGDLNTPTQKFPTQGIMTTRPTIESPSSSY